MEKNIDLSKKELWERLEIAFKNQNLQEFENLISSNKEYFYSDKFRYDLVTILNTEGKFFDTKFIGALLFKISENGNKSISGIKKYIQHELGNLFQEKEKNNQNIEELIDNIKKKLTRKNESYLKQITEFSEKIKKLENEIKNKEKNELEVKKEYKILNNIATEYSEIFKTLIENNFLVGNNPINSVEELIKGYKVLAKFLEYLEKNGLLMKNQKGGYGISPKVRSALNEINNPKKENIIFKININEPEKEKTSSVVKKSYQVEEYNFKKLEDKNNSKQDKNDELKKNEEAKIDLYGDFLVHMDDIKKTSKEQQNKIEQLKQENIEKDKKISEKEIQNLEQKLEMEQLKQEIEKQQKQIEKQQKQIEQLEKEKEKEHGKKGLKNKHPKHKLEKAKKAYEENE